MAAVPQKVLVTGQASNSLRLFFTKLAALQTKHSFSLCLALDLFSNISNDSIELAELLAGKIDVPVQVYVAVGGGILPRKVLDKMEKGEEICTNVTVLNKAGVLTLASGLRIATFGGSYDQVVFDSMPAEGEAPVSSLSTSNFSQSDISTFVSLLTPPPSKSSLPSPPLPSPDILITHSIPSSLPLLSTKPLTTSSTLSPPLDEIAKLSKAKYHFISGAGVFWEREPLNWPREMGGGSCRAICLGELGNKAKERWFYAFSITPKAPHAAPPSNATASPFVAGAGGSRGTKRPAAGIDSGVNEYGIPNFIFGGNDRKKGKNAGGAKGPPPEHYTCNICDKKGHWIQECPEKTERDAERADNRPSLIKPIQPDECWFCLSNPQVTKHLIASIGEEVYVTLPKGQIPPTGSSVTEVSPVPGGGHVLIIPIAHYATTLSIPAEVASPILTEIEQYKKGLKDCYAEYGAKLVSFELGRLSGLRGGHAHIQICPIPNEIASKAEAHFRSEGEKAGITFAEDSVVALKEAASSGDYFRVGLPDGGELVHIIKPNTRFNLQFGRATLATLLGVPERIDWKACGQSVAEEKRDCQAFKGAFKKFDPSE